MGLILDIEKIIKSNAEGWLHALEKYWACPIHIYRVVKNTTTKVYGTQSGEEVVHPTFLKSIEGIVVSDDFFPVDPKSGGSFVEGWLYSTSSLMDVGDRVEIDRDDFRNRRYNIVSKQAVGTTQSVFHKYRLSSLGD